MDKNQQRFVADALDLLNELDEGLMQLEATPFATAPLEQVFRTMHTLKGGANMFGFDNIGQLAHQLETIYDLVRQGKLQVTDRLISITLNSFDKVRSLLQEKDFAKITHIDALKESYQAALGFLHQFQADSLTSFSAVPSSEGMATYLIQVKPTIEITEDGTHPLVFIVQDIADLGPTLIHLAKKENGKIDYWNICISTTVSQPELESYFIFVEDESQVVFTHITIGNLLEDDKFRTCVEKYYQHELSLEELAAMVGQFSAQNPSVSLDETETESAGSSQKGDSDTIIKVSKRKIDDLLNLVSELIILQAQLSTINSQLNAHSLNHVTEQIELVTNRLRDTSLEIGLVPIETLVTRFKRLVRDISKTLGKKINFLSEGTETEMDKDVIEVMAEPIMHIIRNSIDHGIESIEQRKAVGKSEYGSVKLKAFNSGGFIHIHISDDGKGINPERVLQKAIENGLVQAHESLSEEEILKFIFHPGLSTATHVSDISGRGVGMDVVKQKITELRGSIVIKNTIGQGVSFQIKLPLSRSIIEGLLVKVAQTHYILPLNLVEQINRLPYESLNRDNHLNKTILVNEELLPVFSLSRQFHQDRIPPKTADVITILANGRKKGLVVDRTEGKIQAVLKPLGEAYRQQDFIAGSSILGDGSLAFVLDPDRLFQLESI
ncbi:chemotaxis protein CheA [Cytophagaceae bacterium DM2B3-1]|uniref:Chemotaxis protein CheA n=1 Tax=Xanthocytophaga flava TaxID=3048013 RepID=A0ABT7CEL5_9BACT|nr:chemotaxis protein CheA [Xanthocytophaga flavus]MDJ1492178.1 chemotaxis protein CheA [Xanthocytophaga flavus]